MRDDARNFILRGNNETFLKNCFQINIVFAVRSTVLVRSPSNTIIQSNSTRGVVVVQPKQYRLKSHCYLRSSHNKKYV